MIAQDMLTIHSLLFPACMLLLPLHSKKVFPHDGKNNGSAFFSERNERKISVSLGHTLFETGVMVFLSSTNIFNLQLLYKV